MLHDRCATVKMEEGYMRLSIEYTESKSRSTICDTIGDIERELDVFPEVLHRRIEGTQGTFSIEFSGESYINERTAGNFIEQVLKKLDIKECDSE